MKKKRDRKKERGKEEEERKQERRRGRKGVGRMWKIAGWWNEGERKERKVIAKELKHNRRRKNEKGKRAYR